MINYTEIINTLLFVLSIIFNIVGTTIQQTSMPLWLNDWSEPMGILISCSLFYVTIFGILMLLFSKRYYPHKSSWKILCLAGLCDALNSIFIVYASQSNRVPAILQPILYNLNIFSVILSNKLILSDKKKYFNWYVLISIFLILLSVSITSIPFYTNKNVENPNEFIGWSMIYVIGACFGIVFNIYQSIFYKNEKEELIKDEQYHIISTQDREINNIINMEKISLKHFFSNSFILLFYQCLFQFISILSLIWIDLLPGFGRSTVNNLSDNLLSMFKCNFTNQCGNSYIYYLVFNIGYMLSYVGSCYLNLDNSPFNILFMALATPISIIFWIIAPYSDTLSGNINLLYVIPGLIFTIFALLIWKFWEYREILIEKRQTSSYITSTMLGFESEYTDDSSIYTIGNYYLNSLKQVVSVPKLTNANIEISNINKDNEVIEIV